MSKKRWLIVPLCAVLCSQGLFAQTPGRKVLGINEMFRLADENSQSIQTYKTGKEAADEALKAAKVTTIAGYWRLTLVQLSGRRVSVGP